MGCSLKDGVIADATRYFDQYRGTGSWLNKGLNFDHSFKLKRNQKEILDIILGLCGISKRTENYLNLEILIANLLRKRDIRPLIVSLNTRDWKLTQYTRAGESTIKLIHELNDNGYIELKKGYGGEQESRKARIWTTDKLLDYFPLYRNAVIYDPIQVVVLRDDSGNLKEYRDTARTREIRRILKRVNEVNETADINSKRNALYTSLTAIFKRKFTLNGRLHTRGNRHYQRLSSDERKKITINNISVVELDFSGLHPFLLYAKEGVQLSEDPYSIVDKRPEVRTFLKNILLCMLNPRMR